MSSFTKPLRLEFKDDCTFDLLETFEYYTNKIKHLDGTNVIITVPVGFNTDFASVPKVFRSFIAVLDKHAKAAVVHDYLYEHGYDKYVADKIFYEAMTVLEVSLWKRGIMFIGVRLNTIIKDFLKKEIIWLKKY